MYRYLLFDLDGTLTDSAPGITRCVQYAMESLGFEEKPELCREDEEIPAVLKL